MAENGFVYYSIFLVILLFAIFKLFTKYEYSIVDVDNQYDRYVKRNKTVYFATFCIIGYIVFWASIRNGVADTLENIYNYEHMDKDVGVWQFFMDQFTNDEKAPLFETYKLICVKLGLSSQFYLASVAIASGICLVYAIGHYSDDVVLSCYIFVASVNFFWLFNGIRQFLAVCIFFACLRLVAERKFWKFLVLVLILYLIHSSAIILIPIYFISNFKTWSWQIWLCIIVIMVLVIVFPNQINGMIDSLFPDYGYSNAIEGDDGVNFLRVAVAAVTPLIAWVFRKDIDEYHNKLVDVMINMSLITVGLYAVGVVTSGIFIGRLPIYTELINTILLPFLIKRIVTPRLRPFILISCIVFFFLFFYLQDENMYYTTFLFESMNLKG